jgi:hypothetical protein
METILSFCGNTSLFETLLSVCGNGSDVYLNDPVCLC